MTKRDRQEPGRIAERVKRAIAMGVRKKLDEDPEAFRKAVELGILDPTWLDDPTGRPLSELFDVASFRERLAERVREEPSLLGALEVSAVDVLGSAPQNPEAVPLPEAREELTVVFTDLEGFTAYTATAGDVAASRLLAVHYDEVDSLVRGRGGSVVKTLGDGHMLTFSEPSAAVLAAGEMIQVAPGPMRVRCGAHLGEVTRLRSDVLGHVVNIAARVTGVAGGGEALVTESVRSAAGEARLVRFGPLQHRWLKGVEEELALYPVTLG